MIRYLLGKVVVFIHTLATNQNSYMDFLFVRQLAKRSTNNHFQLASARWFGKSIFKINQLNANQISPMQFVIRKINR